MRQNYRMSHFIIGWFNTHVLPAKKFSTFRVSSPIWCEHKYWDSCLTGLSKWSAVSCYINSSDIKSREYAISVIAITSMKNAMKMNPKRRVCKISNNLLWQSMVLRRLWHRITDATQQDANLWPAPKIERQQRWARRVLELFMHRWDKYEP